MLAVLIGFATTTESLVGKELLDFRFVAPAGHMQPWPDDDADILIDPPASLRIASKWRTNLRGKQADDAKELSLSQDPKTPSPSPAPENRGGELGIGKQFAVQATSDAKPTKLPQPNLADTLEQAEVLDLPPAPQQSTTPRECYEAPPLSALSASIALPAGTLPTDTAALCAAQTTPTGDARLIGAWPCTEHHWSATCMHHRPLYFEEINAERYGYTVSYVMQPIISAAKFFATIPALPYKMTLERPRDCSYTLGHYRPGSCVPRRCNRLPLDTKAAAVETGVIAGLILLIP